MYVRRLPKRYLDRSIDRKKRMQELHDKPREYFLDNIGKYCCKTVASRGIRRCDSISQPKSFKSGSKINRIKGIIEHPILKIPAYTFFEDDSYVECRRVKVFEVSGFQIFLECVILEYFRSEI